MKVLLPASVPAVPWFSLAIAALALLAPELRAQEPAPPPAEQIDPGSLGWVRVDGTEQDAQARVWFQKGSAALDAEDLALLREVALAMADHPEILRVAVLGHASTDEGAKARALGQRRAEAARDALVASGVDPVRLVVGSWGTERPMFDSGTAAGRAHNRVVEFVVCGEGGCELPP